MSLAVLAFFVLGLVFLVGGAELLVRGASRLAATLGVSPLIIGLTVVAYGTSAPEMAVSLTSGFDIGSSISIGNVVGSNICNVLLVLGVSATIAPLAVSQRLVKLEVPLMLGLSVLLFCLARDGSIGFRDGLLLSTGGVVYTGYLIWEGTRKTDVQAEFAEEIDIPEDNSPVQRAIDGLCIAIGAILLTKGSDWLVSSASSVARAWGVSDLVVGLTVVAFGTSLPEGATSVIASLRGERDLAVGNVVGSNIFNILAVLGLAGAVAPAGIMVTEAAVNFDIPVMIAVALACLPIFFTGSAIARWEGILFSGYYIAYVAYLILRSTEHESLPIFSGVLLWFALPLTAVTLVVVALRERKRRPQKP
ncbi:MAG: calcium/sodium antiporter [Cyanobacteria bacterium J06641_5]